jgi:flagellar basal-body rod protein FlgB
MAIADLPLLGGLKTSMQWHQSRQKVLAENVANADTPGYRGKDLKALQLGAPGTVARPTMPALALAVSDPGHIPGRTVVETFAAEKVNGFEVTPNGNAVDLEEQMIKSSANQVEFQAVSSLYERSLGLLRKAVSKS